ncbi:MAG: hypothetical protein K2G87_12260 [Oscillospiraceae bacterium]|nr:hypothetical protein [Oscillospiraceae bacterium]
MAEIVLVGTFHYPERFDIFSQDVQNQIDEFTNRLASFHPNKIAVEFPYGMQNKLDELYARSEKHCFGENVVYCNIERYGSIVPFKSVNEIVQIGFRLGKKLNHDKIYGIDEDIELSDELFEKITPYMDMNSSFEKMRMITEKAHDLKGLYAIHNSDEYITFDHSMYIAMNKINLGNYEGSQLVLQWYERNLKIFSNLQNVCEKEDKVLVLIGSSHLKILKELIRSSSEMDLCEEI